jgi:hypothetical protein
MWAFNEKIIRSLPTNLFAMELNESTKLLSTSSNKFDEKLATL